MRVVVTDIRRSVVKAYMDRYLQEFTISNEYNIGFTIKSKGSYMSTDIDITYDGHMSFDKAHEIVEDKLGIRGG